MSAPPRPAPPAVLLITADQQRADTLGAYGSRVGATPNLDRLAAGGATFSEARCQHPYCQPSRWTILTGQHARRHGVWSNGVDPSAAEVERALSTQLGRAGVRTGIIGKAHLATNGVLSPWTSPYMEALPNALRMPADWRGPYMGFDHAELVQLGHFPFGYGPAPLGLHYGRWLAQAGRRESLRRFRLASPMGSLSGGQIAPQTWHSGLPEELHPTTWIGDRAVSWLEQHAAEPFFLWVSFPDPHHPFAPPAPWCHRFDPEAMSLPDRSDDLSGKPPWQKRFSDGLGVLASWLNTPGGRVSARDLGRISAAYHGMIAQIDHQIGRLLGALERAGRADSVLVVFSSDHGELLGDHRLLFKGPFHYDGLLKVPLVLRGPGVPAGTRSDAPVGLIDLAPTLAAHAGVTLPEGVQGRSLWPVLAGREQREAVFTENDHDIGFSEHVQTVVTREHKLSRHLGRDYGELYFRADDPGENHNRWGEPATLALRRQLEALLDAELGARAAPRRRRVSWLPA